MMASIQDLQDQLAQTNTKLSQDINNVSQDHENFKQEMRRELLRLNQVSGLPSSVLSSPTPPPATIVPSITQLVPSSGVNLSSPIMSSSAGSAPTDVQLQMMQLLNDTFSKLSVVLDTKSSDTKSEWPKFQGDHKKFRGWHLAILAQMCLPPWKELYDSTTNGVMLTTGNTALNEKLYAKLLTCLEAQVLQNMVSCKHLRADGLLLLQELVQTYRPKNVPEVITAKTGEFWSNTKCHPSKTVDAYYNRFHELLDDLIEGEEPISDRSAICHLIFTLGPEFETIQNNYRTGNLPEEWKTHDWAKLLILCRDYSNYIHPQGLSKKNVSPDSSFSSHTECMAHHKKIKMWFLNPVKYCVEI